MPVLLIDDRGKLWESHSLVLRSRLRASIDDRELHKFAILNLGFIGLAISKASIRIQLRPVLVKPAALSALYLWLHQCAPERVVVTRYNGHWRDEIVGWHHDGWRRITCLLESPERPTPGFSRATYSARSAGRGEPLAARPRRFIPADQHRRRTRRRCSPHRCRERYLLLTEDDNRELRVREFRTRDDVAVAAVAEAGARSAH